MSSVPFQAQPLISLYSEASKVTPSATSGIWDDLLNLIEGVIKKVLNTSIGGTGKTINDIINDVKTSITSTITGVKTTVDGIVGKVETAINGAISGIDTFVSGLVSSVSAKVDQVITDVGKIVNNVVTGVTGKIDEILGGIGDAIETAIGWLRDKIQGVIDQISTIGTQFANAISGAISNIGNFISNAVNDAIATVTAIIVDVIENVKNWLVTTYNNILQGIKDFIQTAKDWIEGVYKNISDWFNRTIQSLKDTYESVKGVVLEWIDKALAWGSEVRAAISKWFWQIVSNVAGWVKTNVFPVMDNVIMGAQGIWGLLGKTWEFVSKGDYQGAFNLVDSFMKAAGIPAPVQTLHSIVSTLAYFWETVHLQFVGMEVAASKHAEIGLALEPISSGEAAAAVFKGVWGEKDFYANASLAGIAPSRAKASFEASKNLPTPGQTQQLFLRGEIKEAEHDTILASYGFSEQHIKEIKSLYAIIPSVTDIITMAVKEAFTPDIATKFGQYEDLPEAFVSWAAKQGLSKDWASRYWAAHWDLPSPQMGFTMYQRGIVDKDSLKLLLKALDIMPFWREKLIELSYNPPTRVDIRRMYKMGVITEDQVYKFHLDIGYSPDNARLLTDFTKRYSAPEDESDLDKYTSMARTTYSSAYVNHVISQEEYRTFLKALRYADEDVELFITLDDYDMVQKDKLFDPTSYRKDYQKLILQGYNRGLFNREDAKPLLLDMGYGEDEAELELSLLDYNRQLTIKDTLLNQLHSQYVGYMIDDTDLHTILDTFGFYAAEVDRLIEEWSIERNFRDKRPSITDLKSFLNKGLISLDEFLDELRGIGYNERYIPLYAKTLAKEAG